MGYQTYDDLSKLHKARSKLLEELVVKMAENQVKLIVAMKDAFHTRDQLIQLVDLCKLVIYREHGENLSADDRALLEMRTVPNSLYEELSRRELDVQEALAEVGLVQEKVDL